MKYLMSLYFIFMSLTLHGQLEFERHPVLGNSNRGGVSVGDIDSDGHLDIILLSYNQYISWYRNIEGTGNFAQLQLLVEVPPSIFAVNTTLGDLDNDGDVDILTYSFAKGEIAWHENVDGLDDFGKRQLISDNIGRPAQLSLVDIDGDNDLDLLGASFLDEEVFWYENTNEQGIFGEKHLIFNDRVSKLRTGDIDQDGDIDILFSSVNDDKVAWFKNIDGKGDFDAEQILPTNSNGPNEISLADLDNDGDLDVITNSIHDDILYWNANIDGQGTYGSQHLIASESLDASSLQAEDIDGDGDMDILIASGDDLLVWHENLNGQGSFGNQQTIVEFDDLGSFFIADFDSDGNRDILVDGINVPPGLSWYKNEDGQGDYRLAPPFVAAHISSGISSHAADLDSDGDMDILYSTQGGDQVAWSENLDGSGTFINVRIINDDEDEANSVYPADLDNDGDTDVISSSKGDNKRIVWYENLDGLGNFSAPSIIMDNNNSLFRILKIAAFDADGDEDMDIVSAFSKESMSDEGELYLHRNDGQGNFSGPELIIKTSLNFLSDFVFGDLDKDGATDLVTVAHNGVVARVRWYKNNGSGFFSDASTIFSKNSRMLTSLSINDLNSDGNLDIIVGSDDAASSYIDIYWFENMDGLGDFNDGQHIVTDIQSYTPSVHSADLDNDGDIDILSASDYFGSQYNLSWYENIDGQGTFGDQITIDSGLVGISGIETADIDLNGNLDVISISANLINWYRSNAKSKNQILGQIKVDVDEGDCENTTIIAPNQLVTTTNGLDTFSTFSLLTNGTYKINTFEGEFLTSIINNFPHYSVTPDIATSTFIDLGNKDTVNFCYLIEQEINDLSIIVIPRTAARPAFPLTYTLVYKNLGSTVLDGTINLEFDDTKLEYIQSSELPSVQSDKTLEFEFTDLGLFETRTIVLEMRLFPIPIVNIEDVLVFNAHIESTVDDDNETDNTFSLEQNVIGSYDPNDISVYEGKEITVEETDEYLHYLIRFQNTGNAEAINVRVENLLDSHLDWKTLQLENVSHPNRVEITDNKLISFIFENIYLPDSTSNEAESHGHITYKVKPKAEIQLGDSIQNNASIFFDFNPPIITNTVSTKIVATLDVNEIDLTEQIKIIPNPNNGIFNIQWGTLQTQKLCIRNINGQVILSEDNIQESINELHVEFNTVGSGIYFLEIITASDRLIYPILKYY